MDLTVCDSLIGFSKRILIIINIFCRLIFNYPPSYRKINTLYIAIVTIVNYIATYIHTYVQLLAN